MEAQKKNWIKPSLIILGRGTPDEAVLASCKGTTTKGAILRKDICRSIDNCGAAACSTFSAS